jgi:Mn2+/Fe2+ NRAMP family transporter
MTKNDETEVSDGNMEMKKLAHDYAWSWFEYHAGQRMSVFRFFMVFATVTGAAVIQAYKSEMYFSTMLLGIVLLLASFAFWRLDLRSADLIKVAERYLGGSELDLARVVGKDIRLTYESDNPHNPFAKDLRFKRLLSFRVVFGWIFKFAMAVGLITALVGGAEYYSQIDQAKVTVQGQNKEVVAP